MSYYNQENRYQPVQSNYKSEYDIDIRNIPELEHSFNLNSKKHVSVRNINPAKQTSNLKVYTVDSSNTSNSASGISASSQEVPSSDNNRMQRNSSYSGLINYSTNNSNHVTAVHSNTLPLNRSSFQNQHNLRTPGGSSVGSSISNGNASTLPRNSQEYYYSSNNSLNKPKKRLAPKIPDRPQNIITGKSSSQSSIPANSNNNNNNQIPNGNYSPITYSANTSHYHQKSAAPKPPIASNTSAPQIPVSSAKMFKKPVKNLVQNQYSSSLPTSVAASPNNNYRRVPSKEYYYDEQHVTQRSQPTSINNSYVRQHQRTPVTPRPKSELIQASYSHTSSPQNHNINRTYSQNQADLNLTHHSRTRAVVDNSISKFALQENNTNNTNQSFDNYVRTQKQQKFENQIYMRNQQKSSCMDRFDCQFDKIENLPLPTRFNDIRKTRISNFYN